MISEVFIQPTAFDILPAVEIRHIRFYVEHRRAVQNIHLAEVQFVHRDFLDFHNRQTYVIGPMWASYGEWMKPMGSMLMLSIPVPLFAIFDNLIDNIFGL